MPGPLRMLTISAAISVEPGFPSEAAGGAVASAGGGAAWVAGAAGVIGAGDGWLVTVGRMTGARLGCTTADLAVVGGIAACGALSERPNKANRTMPMPSKVSNTKATMAATGMPEGLELEFIEV